MPRSTLKVKSGGPGIRESYSDAGQPAAAGRSGPQDGAGADLSSPVIFTMVGKGYAKSRDSGSKWPPHSRAGTTKPSKA
jgi:hypothetical protein